MAPVHWLCLSREVNVRLLQALLGSSAHAAAVADVRGMLPLHHLCANEGAAAEALLVLLEVYEVAARRVDHFGQLPLHWLLGGAAVRDARSTTLLLSVFPQALQHTDSSGMLPLHWACRSPLAASRDALHELLLAAPRSAAKPDRRGRLPLHVLCSNPALGIESLERVLAAQPTASDAADADGQLPLHRLMKAHPEASDMWQTLMRAGSRGAVASAAAGGAPAQKRASKPAVVVQKGDVAGISGRVSSVLSSAKAASCRSEERGLVLFVSSMSAVKQTADACRQAAALLDALFVRYDMRDIFLNAEYAAQLRRLAPAKEDGSKAMPLLPQLYINGVAIGGLSEMNELNETQLLLQQLADFKLDHAGLGQADRACEACGGQRFVVCAVCHGSRRGQTAVFGRTLKCSHCNAQGLQPCKHCNADVV